MREQIRESDWMDETQKSVELKYIDLMEQHPITSDSKEFGLRTAKLVAIYVDAYGPEVLTGAMQRLAETARQ